MIQKCKQCGRTFELADSEIAFYNRKGLDLPKRCESCRKKNRSAHKNDEPEMPGIQQVRQVDPGYKRDVPTYQKSQDSGFSGVERSFPSAVKEKKKIPPFVALVVVLVLVVIGAIAGTSYAISNVGKKAAELDSPAASESISRPTYYLNTYRKKFHRPNCESVQQMDPDNRQAFYGTREEAIKQGYSPCNNCKP